MTSKAHMIVVNLHEIDFLEDVLNELAEEFVRDCVVYNAEGVKSRHGSKNPVFGFSGASLTSLFKESRNLNYIIMAITEEAKIEVITERLKKIQTESRWASSFWFVPLSGYFYHMGNDAI